MRKLHPTEQMRAHLAAHDLESLLSGCTSAGCPFRHDAIIGTADICDCYQFVQQHLHTIKTIVDQVMLPPYPSKSLPDAKEVLNDVMQLLVTEPDHIAVAESKNIINNWAEQSINGGQ